MGKINKLYFAFSNDKTVYLAGETVFAKCVIECQGETTVKSLQVLINGKANVMWSETSKNSDGSESTRYYNAEVSYFNFRYLLLGTDSSSSRVVLNNGTHEYKFQFHIPRDIPTSFNGIYGSIRYWFTAIIGNRNSEVDIAIISPIDINRKEYQMQILNTIENKIGCCCFKSGPISITAKTDRRGYCAGESIAISAEFENLSSRKIIPYAKLIQTQLFFAEGLTQNRKIEYGVLTGQPIPGRSRATWDAQLLNIPAVQPTINNCAIIKVEYYVKVCLRIPRAINLQVHLPIVIGTVPYRGAPSNLSCAPSLLQPTAVPPTTHQPSIPFPLPVLPTEFNTEPSTYPLSS